MGLSVVSPSAPGRGTPCCHLGQDDSLALDGLCCTERSPSAGVSTSAVSQRRLTCRAHQRTPFVWRHVAFDGFGDSRGELLIIYRIYANHGWFLRKRSSLLRTPPSQTVSCSFLTFGRLEQEEDWLVSAKIQQTAIQSRVAHDASTLGASGARDGYDALLTPH